MAGTLYIVSTPIGNLEDITHRAVRVLSNVDTVACEDTRHTRKLLDHYGIKARTISYHEHNERERAAELSELLKSGSDVAIVSDSGTPGISDPGFRLIRMAARHGIQVVPVPGPTALIAALVASGLPSDEFFFGGFLPARSNARRTRLAELRLIPSTVILYEAPHRIRETLKDAREILGEREAVVARELTKVHEEIARGKLSDLAKQFALNEKPRGEMVIVIDKKEIPMVAENNDMQKKNLAVLIAEFEAEGIDSRMALKKAAKRLGISRDEAYRRLVAERSRSSMRALSK
jgi:16S rRNA (cytidine1402-2'-O)-methyltransferase